LVELLAYSLKNNVQSRILKYCFSCRDGSRVPVLFSYIKLYETYFVLLHGLVFHAINTTNILYRRGKLATFRCEVGWKPCKNEDFASAAPRRWGGIGQSLRDSLQVELDPLLSSQLCTHLELNLAQCTLSKNDGAGTMFSSEKLFWDPVHNKALAQCTLSSSEHWLSAPCLHHSTRSVHPVIIRALVQCILPLSRHCLSATYRHRNFGSVHPSTIPMYQVLITVLFCRTYLSKLKHLFSAYLQEVMSSLKAQVLCIPSISKYFYNVCISKACKKLLM